MSTSKVPVRIYTWGVIPEVLEGEVYEWTQDLPCRSGQTMVKGSLARVIERTGMTPYGEIMARGHNLLIDTNGKTTVWATFEQCVSIGLLKKVKPVPV